MFGLFKRKPRPKEVVCYPTEYHVEVRLADGVEVNIMAGYGDSALSEAMEFVDWFDKSCSEVFVGSSVKYRSRADIRISRRSISTVRAWSYDGKNCYKNMGGE